MSNTTSFAVIFTRIVDPTAQQTADILDTLHRAEVHVVDDSIAGMILVQSNEQGLADALLGSQEWFYSPVVELSA